MLIWLLYCGRYSARLHDVRTCVQDCTLSQKFACKFFFSQVRERKTASRNVLFRRNSNLHSKNNKLNSTRIASWSKNLLANFCRNLTKKSLMKAVCWMYRINSKYSKNNKFGKNSKLVVKVVKVRRILSAMLWKLGDRNRKIAKKDYFY